MTDNFLIMLDTYGKIKFFYLPESTFSILKNTFQGIMVTAVRELLSIEDIKKNLPPIVTILDKDVNPLILSNGYLVLQKL